MFIKANMPTSPIPGPGLASRANSGSLHVDRLLHVYPALPYQASDPLSSPVLIRYISIERVLPFWRFRTDGMPTFESKPAPPLPFHPNKKQPAIAPLQIMAPHSKLLHSNAPSSDIELGAIGLPIPLHLELPGESIIELELPAQLQFPDSVQIQPERLEKDPKIDEPRAIPRLEIQDYSDLEILASAADLIESEANQPEPEPEDDGDWRKPKPSKSRSRKRKRAAKRYRDVAPDPEATIVPHDDPGSGEHQPENTEQIVATVNSGPGPNLGICTLADSELWKMFCEAGNEIVVSRPGR